MIIYFKKIYLLFILFTISKGISDDVKLTKNENQTSKSDHLKNESIEQNSTNSLNSTLNISTSDKYDLSQILTTPYNNQSIDDDLKEAINNSIRDNGKPELKIIGGKEAAVGQFPFQVYLARYFLHASFACGGSIISSKHVLTAAHCIVTTTLGKQHAANPMDIDVLAGSLYRDTGFTLYESDKIFIHENYRNRAGDDDIGIIKIINSFDFSRTMGLVALSDVSPKTGDTVTVCGWGRTAMTGHDTPRALMFVELTVKDSQECKPPQRTICAGVLEEGKAVYHGDSGGPLLFNNKQVGVVSRLHVLTAGGKGYNLYTEIVPYQKWIKNVLNGAVKNSLVNYYFCILSIVIAIFM